MECSQSNNNQNVEVQIQSQKIKIAEVIKKITVYLNFKLSVFNDNVLNL